MNADLGTVIQLTKEAERLAAWYRPGPELGDPDRASGHNGFQIGSV